MDEAEHSNVNTTQLKVLSSKLTNFPIRHRPRIGHPVGHIRSPVPCSLRGRDGIKVGIGCILGRCKAAGLLSNFEAETRETAAELAYVTGSNGLLNGRGNRRGMLLAIVEDLVVGHGGVMLWGRVLRFWSQVRD